MCPLVVDCERTRVFPLFSSFIYLDGRQERNSLSVIAQSVEWSSWYYSFIPRLLFFSPASSWLTSKLPFQMWKAPEDNKQKFPDSVSGLTFMVLSCLIWHFLSVILIPQKDATAGQGADSINEIKFQTEKYCNALKHILHKDELRRWAGGVSNMT